MISHRAFVYGAREIANDLIMGCLSTEGLKTMQGIDLSNEDIIDITEIDRKSTRLNSSHSAKSRMPSSA